MSDAINPSHYRLDGKKECIEEIKDLIGVNATCYFCIGNAYKYMYRAGNKDGNSYEQDINKCKWYIAWIAKQIKNDEIDVIDDENLLKSYATIIEKLMEL